MGDKKRMQRWESRREDGKEMDRDRRIEVTCLVTELGSHATFVIITPNPSCIPPSHLLYQLQT